MRLTNLFEYQIGTRKISLIEQDHISIGMTRYDVDMDDDGDRIHLRVLQNGMDVSEVIYEDGEIVWIHVEPFFRNQGMGSAMVKFLQDKGYPVVMPDARTGDGKAFFAKLDQKGKLDESPSYDTNVFDQIYNAIYRDRTFARETSTTIDRFIEAIERDYEEILWWNPETPNVADTTEFWEGFKHWLHNRYREVLDTLQSDIGGYPVKVGRAMTITKEWNPTQHGVGLYWAIPNYEYHAFSGKEGAGYHELDMYAMINETDINWFDTLRSRLDFDNGAEEGEIQLRPDIKIQVVDMRVERPTYGNKETSFTNPNVRPGTYPTTTASKLDEARKPWLRTTPEMYRQAKGNKCQVVVEMPAETFIAMTTSTEEQRQIIRDKSRSIKDYNQWAKAGNDSAYRDRLNVGKTKDDRDYAWGTIHMPFLQIKLHDQDTGTITGHEGRHRSAASIVGGNQKVHVSLCMDPDKEHPAFKDGNHWDSRYHTTSDHLPKYLKGQFDGKLHSTRDWKIINGNIQGAKMKEGDLEEITLAGSFDDDRSGEFRRFDPAKTNYHGDTSVGSIASEQDISSVGSKQFFFTNEDGDPIGYAYAQFGTLATFGYARTSMIWIADEYRGRGIAGDYYEFLLHDAGRTLMSDDEHSPESYQVWWKLVQKYVATDQSMTPINSEEQFDDMYDSDNTILIHPKLRKQPM